MTRACRKYALPLAGILALMALLAPTLASTQAADEPAPPPVRWVEQRGQASDLALSPDSTAWALDASGMVWRMSPGGEQAAWNKLPGQFQRLRVTHDGSAWGLDAGGQLYRLEGSIWRPVLAGVLDVATAPDGQAWVLRGDGRVTELKTGAALPLPDTAPAQAFAVDPHGLLWLLYGDGRLLRFTGREWEPLATPAERLSRLAIGLDGNVLGIDSAGALWRRHPETGAWQPYAAATGALLRQVAIDARGLPWVATDNGRILAGRYTTEPDALPRPPATFTRLLSWRAIGGKASQVSIGSDSSVYSLDTDGVAWGMRRKNDATMLGGRFSTIAAGSGGVAWALDGEQNLHQLDQRIWRRLPARAQLLAVGENNRLFAALSGQRIARWSAAEQAWQPLAQAPSEVRALALGRRDRLWIIDASATVRTLEAGQWRELPGIRAASLGAGADGTVYAAAADRSIWWLDPREMNWKPATGKARQIAVGPSGAPWAIAPEGQLLASARFMEEAEAREAAALAEAEASRRPEVTILPLWPLPTLNQPLNFVTLAGPVQLRDIAIGADGSIFGVGGGGEFLCFSNPDRRFNLISRGKSQRVGVSAVGAPWLVGGDGIVSRFEKGRWRSVPEFTAQDVAGGPDGKVWATGTDGQSYLYDVRSDRFLIQPVTTSDKAFKARRIAGANAGVSWVVSEERQLFRCEKGSCRLSLLAATDIAVAPDNLPFALDALGTVQRFNPRNKSFERQRGQGVAIGVGPQGLPWLVMPDGRVQHAGLILPQSKRINPANCAAPFAQAPTPDAPAGSLKAVDDATTLSVGGSLDLLANDRIAARTPTLTDVAISLDARGSGLVLQGGSVIVPQNAQPGAVLSAGYRICPKQGFSPCASATLRVTVASPAVPTAPGAPTGVVAMAGNAQASVSFVAPASNGGSPILGYTVIASPGGFSTSGSGSPLIVSGLSNGQSYTFTVTATNAIGSSVASAPSNAATPGAPATVPGAPTGATAVAGNAQASVSFSAPASNGGSAILGYTVTSNPGGLSASGSGSPLIVAGLSNGLAYNFTVTATNAIGTGPASAPTNIVTPGAPATTPGAPTAVSALAGNAQASISFSAPASNGGSPVTAYTVISNPGGLSATGTASPLSVSGLTNGQSYTFRVTASNAIGAGPASLPSNAVTPTAPASTPGAPTAVNAVAGNAQATISFLPPASDGGSPISGYTVTSNPGGLTASGAASPLIVAGLTNGQSYSFTVTASNTTGTGPASAPSNTVTPTTPATVPGAPTGANAVAGNAQATISFAAPASNGGSPITGYTVTSSPGGLSATGTASPLTISGLTNGQSYSFTITASNAVGAGPASAQSNTVTPAAPATTPGAPTGASAVAGNAQATISFSAPASNGGSPITSYTVTSSPGGLSASGTASPLVVNGLGNGQGYTFTVRATNSVGTGPASLPTNAVTPMAPVTVPGAPINVSATPGTNQATVNFSVPASNGGSPILSYTATSNPDGLTATGSGAPLTVTGLSNGQSYTFTVRATNAVGSGPASAPSNAVTPAQPPGPPLQVNGVPGDSSVTVSFFPGFNVGPPILGYTVTSSPGGITASGSGSPIVVNGLTNGVAYTFTVTATNEIGTGPASTPSPPLVPTP